MDVMGKQEIARIRKGHSVVSDEEQRRLEAAGGHLGRFEPDKEGATLSSKVPVPETQPGRWLETGGFLQDLLSSIGNLLPESLPINIKQEITLQNTTFLDGQQIAQSLETRQYQEFATATRRAGAVGYERV